MNRLKCWLKVKRLTRADLNHLVDCGAASKGAVKFAFGDLKWFFLYFKKDDVSEWEEICIVDEEELGGFREKLNRMRLMGYRPGGG